MLYFYQYSQLLTKDAIEKVNKTTEKNKGRGDVRK